MKSTEWNAVEIVYILCNEKGGGGKKILSKISAPQVID